MDDVKEASSSNDDRSERENLKAGASDCGSSATSEASDTDSSDGDSSNGSEEDDAPVAAVQSQRPPLKLILAGVGAVSLIVFIVVLAYLGIHGSQSPSDALSNSTSPTAIVPIAPDTPTDSSPSLVASTPELPPSTPLATVASAVDQSNTISSKTSLVVPEGTASNPTGSSTSSASDDLDSSSTGSTLTGYPTILRTIGSHGTKYDAQKVLLQQYSQVFAGGKYWITNTATNQVMNLGRGALMNSKAAAHTANVYLAPKSVSTAVILEWCNFPNLTSAVGFMRSDNQCASAQWEVEIGGFNRAVASYPCGNLVSDKTAADAAGLQKQCWALVPVADAEKITLPSRTDTVTTYMPTDIWTENLVQNRREKRNKLDNRASASPDPSQKFIIISSAHLIDGYTTVMLGANISAWDDEMGIALTDFDVTDPWQTWTIEAAT